jgi:hypothetical protein
MAVLDSKLRSQLDCVCQKARDKAEEAARSALQKRAVDAAEPHPHFTATEKKLRTRLRARGRQAGDVRQANKTQGIEQLTQELAYEYWHRMLFARFLADNNLLMHPDGVAVSLEECEELAASEGAPNGYALAARYASTMLPQIFRTDDVLLEIEFPVNDRLPLEKLLNSLPAEVFTADDSLGWVYQFWQTKRKKEVNDSGEKIDGRTLPAVTQLFTEHYMVQFLLHNTIGAWWCARHAIKGPPGGAGVPVGQVPVDMEYLRWREDGTPAAGTFDGWPNSHREFKMMDPCCGSGHFLVAAFNMLVPLRMQDEGLSAREACDAVLRDNLFGLELDPRCTQIAAFALAVAAWKYASEDGQPLGYRELPPLNIACTGIGPQATETDWLKLAEQSGKPMSVLSREPILDGLRNLHSLFSDAPTLGSLIDPSQLSADLITADYETLQPYLAASLMAEQADDDTHERAVAAAGMVKAAELLAGEYTLAATNVPYLKRGSQNDLAQEYGERYFSIAKSNLATIFYLRWLEHVVTCGLVLPQNWLYQPTYKDFRKFLLTKTEWLLLARLGPGAFETISGEVVNVCLMVGNSREPADGHEFRVSEATKETSPERKAAHIRAKAILPTSQATQLKKPGYIVSSLSHCESLLQDYADSFQGVKTGDDEKLRRCFWEVREFATKWAYYQSTVEDVCTFGGLEHVLFVENKGKDIARYQGLAAWGKLGVAVSQMSNL